MSKYNFQVNVPFIVEQTMVENSGIVKKTRHAFVILEEFRKFETYSQDFSNQHCGYRLANLTLGQLRHPIFHTISEVEQYVERRASWTVLQEDVEYGFDTECPETENER